MAKKKSKFLAEFKEFAVQGSMLDMAVGVIIGGAFKSIVDSLTANVIMPIVSMFIGGLNFESWKLKLPNIFGERLDESGQVIINYLKFGDFLSAIINFVIMAFVIFLIVKTMNQLRTLGKKEAPKEEPAPPKPGKEEALLIEIRDLLKEKQ